MKLTSPKGKEMLAFLPPMYATSRIMQEGVLQPQGRQFDGFFDAIVDVLNQFFVETATWGLDTHELEHGLPVNPTQPTNQRRDKITAKIKGQGTATIRTIRATAESYDNGKIDVIQDHRNDLIIIKFISSTGIPVNLEDFKTAMREVVPAHLEIQYEYNFLTWDDLDRMDLTWDELDALNITWDKWEVYK